jgi:hypothetical protein
MRAMPTGDPNPDRRKKKCLKKEVATRRKAGQGPPAPGPGWRWATSPATEMEKRMTKERGGMAKTEGAVFGRRTEATLPRL